MNHFNIWYPRVPKSTLGTFRYRRYFLGTGSTFGTVREVSHRVRVRYSWRNPSGRNCATLYTTDIKYTILTSVYLCISNFTREIDQGISLFIVQDISESHSFASFSNSRSRTAFKIIQYKIKSVSENICSTNSFFRTYHRISQR